MAVRSPVGRSVATVLILTAVTTALLRVTVPAALTPAGPGSFEDLLVRTCAAVASVGTAWLWLGMTAVGLATLCGTPAPAVPGLPDWVRGLVLAGCGAALVSASASPALAVVAGPDLPVPERAEGTMAGSHERRAPDGARGPEGRSAASAAGAHGSHRARRAPGASNEFGTHCPAGRAAPTSVAVRPGDSLWSIAGRHLGPAAGDAAIDAHWRVLYAHNAAVLGDDPDLILPGQLLRLPAARPGPEL